MIRGIKARYLMRSFGESPSILYSSTVDGVLTLGVGAGENIGVDGSSLVPSPEIYRSIIIIMAFFSLIICAHNSIFSAPFKGNNVKQNIILMKVITTERNYSLNSTIVI